jgi:uncharacterized SAM-binding protein YcdF (DUF218 family)
LKAAYARQAQQGPRAAGYTSLENSLQLPLPPNCRAIPRRARSGSLKSRGERIVGRRMTVQPNLIAPRVRAYLWLARLRALVLAMLAIAFAVAGIGFLTFLSQLREAETRPDRKADGIVVLTGGSSRVSDGMELLAGGYGKRLLISGVHPASAASDISRSLSDNQSFLNCCVDLDHSAVNTRSNAEQTRLWAHERGFGSLIVVTSNYHMPRAIVELSHAMPDVVLIPYAVVGEKWRDEPWWTNGVTMRLVLSEYLKYVAAEVRLRLADLGFDFGPEISEPPTSALSRRLAAATAD